MDESVFFTLEDLNDSLLGVASLVAVVHKRDGKVDGNLFMVKVVNLGILRELSDLEVARGSPEFVCGFH